MEGVKLSIITEKRNLYKFIISYEEYSKRARTIIIYNNLYIL
jgi:hypothetical protein